MKNLLLNFLRRGQVYLEEKSVSVASGTRTLDSSICSPVLYQAHTSEDRVELGHHFLLFFFCFFCVSTVKLSWEGSQISNEDSKLGLVIATALNLQKSKINY